MKLNEELGVVEYKLRLARNTIKETLSCDACIGEGDCANCIHDVPIQYQTGEEEDNWTWEYDWIQTPEDVIKHGNPLEEEDD